MTELRKVERYLEVDLGQEPQPGAAVPQELEWLPARLSKELAHVTLLERLKGLEKQ